MELTAALPWGRLASEYAGMFALTPQDMTGRILDCAGGPSSFNAELTRQGRQIFTCDPLYRFGKDEIAGRIDDTYRRMTALTETSKDRFVWEQYGTPARLGETRMRAMRLFLDDYEYGKFQGRYVVGHLPCLPFASDSFDLALCSHFLFTYSEQFSAEFHARSVLELARVATEVRVFPLLAAFTGEISPHLAVVMEALREHGCSADVQAVPYEFQRGGNKMLRVTRDPATAR